MKIKYIAKGLIKSLPGVEMLYKFNKHTGGSGNARYCYSVWLRHFCNIYNNGIKDVPKRIVELGPGDSLGIGLAALLSGFEKYYGLDIVRYGNIEVNEKVLDDVVLLFKAKAPIPGPDEFPRVKPLLESYDFPSHIFTDEKLSYLLNEERLAKIRNAISSSATAGNMIEFIIPWHNSTAIEANSIDVIFSQAVLQHIDELDTAFKNMQEWLKPGCLMSHTIDLGCMKSADEWFGHWQYSDFEWKIVKGRKQFYINREPYSTYCKLLSKYQFELLVEKKITVASPPSKKTLAKKYQHFSTEDLSTKNLYIIARKPAAKM